VAWHAVVGFAAYAAEGFAVMFSTAGRTPRGSWYGNRPGGAVGIGFSCSARREGYAFLAVTTGKKA
jgi:hypothetical protein